MSKKVMISQSNYIPWKGYFDSINMMDEFVLYDDMQYTKRDWRNRNKIKTANGLLWLSVPVEVKGRFFQKINETRVSDNTWQKSHWGTISQAYSRAAFYKEFKPFFEELYLTCNSEYLSEINYHFISGINKLLGITTKLTWSGEFVLAEEKTQRLVNICKDLGASDYYSGPAAKNYMDETLFTKENVNVHYFDYSGYPPYRQLHGEFSHEVSIIDLIFNEGGNATKFMKSFNHG